MATPIWNFQDNEAIDTEKAEMKTYKPTGKFFTDSQVLINLFKIQTHPAIKEATYKPKGTGILDDKEITILNFYKYRLDCNTLKVMQLSLNVQSTIQTLKQVTTLLSFVYTLYAQILKQWLDLWTDRLTDADTEP